MASSCVALALCGVHRRDAKGRLRRRGFVGVIMFFKKRYQLLSTASPNFSLYLFVLGTLHLVLELLLSLFPSKYTVHYLLLIGLSRLWAIRLVSRYVRE